MVKIIISKKKKKSNNNCAICGATAVRWLIVTRWGLGGVALPRRLRLNALHTYFFNYITTLWAAKAAASKTATTKTTDPIHTKCGSASAFNAFQFFCCFDFCWPKYLCVWLLLTLTSWFRIAFRLIVCTLRGNCLVNIDMMPVIAVVSSRIRCCACCVWALWVRKF